MRPIHLMTAVAMLLPALLARPLLAGGILPDRVNQLIIQGRFEQVQPQFIVVFSAQPLRNDAGRPLTTASAAELQALQSTPGRVVLRLYGKPQKNGRLDYFFGTKYDADQPWNSGQDFRWEDWERHSADTWDHIAIALAPGTTPRIASITGVTIRRGGKMLYDSRATKSYPNGRPIQVALRPMLLRPDRGTHPVLNLSDEMANFRTEYYELGDNPILQSAYADLGQTDKRKYANRGNNWCSEFSSFVYRSNDLLTPDPNRGDVHFVNMAEFFAKEGHVYSMREVMTWSDEEKRQKIRPGSFVSILLGDSTHSLIFTTWVEPERGQPITRYAALSGNNKGMVWAHDPLSLPTPGDLAGKTPEQLADYDRKVYFGVPGD